MVRRLSWEASVCEACLGGLFAPTTGSSLFWPRHGAPAAPPRWGKPHAIMFVFPSTVDVFRTQSTWLAGKVPILGTKLGATQSTTRAAGPMHTPELVALAGPFRL